MRRGFFLLSVALLAACGNGDSGGGAKVGSYDQAADEVAKAFQEYGAILDTVTDVKSAEAAKPKLEAMAKRLQGIADGVEKLGPQSTAKTEPKMHEALVALNEKTTAYMMRSFDVPDMSKTIAEQFAAVQSQIPRLRGMLGG